MSRWISLATMLAAGVVSASPAAASCGDTVSIPAIQGAGLRSPCEDKVVTTTGVVIGVDKKGFWIQDPTGDGRPETSDGIRVYLGEQPTAAVGQLVTVTGKVVEYKPKTERRRGKTPASCKVREDEPADHPVDRNATETQITARTVTVGAQAALPAPVTLPGDRAIPALAIDADPAAYSPDVDGFDFWESLEGMRVSLPGAVLVGPVKYGEGAVVPAGTRVTPPGLAVLTDRDQNPERIFVKLPKGLRPGTVFDGMEGVVSYRSLTWVGGVFLLDAVTKAPATPPPATKAARPPAGAPGLLTVASYNVHNLHAGDAKHSKSIAAQIVNELLAPDILVLQEIQDDDGAEGGGVTSAAKTLSALVQAIEEISSVRYEALDNPPAADRADGGQPCANIRTAYLYRGDRVELKGSGSRLGEGDPAFDGTRKSLPARFATPDGSFALDVIGVHLSSRSGSTPEWGQQPAETGRGEERQAQAKLIAEYASKQSVPVLVAGDFNAFWFEPPLREFTKTGFANLIETLPPEERWTYVYNQQAQALDHAVVSAGLAARAELRILHLNAAQAEAPSDHDPLHITIRY
ncbi:MAG: endonuclease/exonuclease/phosphatase family protein [Alphaproteobacteria bacterium]|nr:endonuclease/exonuclease/phosphatase family protein [Alphaproteobacteria bacterium]